MTGGELLNARRETLLHGVRNSYQEAADHSVGFCLRILDELGPEVLPAAEAAEQNVTSTTVQYAGYPAVAYLGFQLDKRGVAEEGTLQSFIAGLTRMRSRTATQLETVAADDVAVLGIACGIAKIRAYDPAADDGAAAWFSDLVARAPDSNLWTSRLRSLAVELLDPKGLLKVSPDLQNPDEAALELALSSVWPAAFQSAAWLAPESQATLL